MKRILRLFPILIITILLFTLSSCGLVDAFLEGWHGDTETAEVEDVRETEVEERAPNFCADVAQDDGHNEILDETKSEISDEDDTTGIVEDGGAVEDAGTINDTGQIESNAGFVFPFTFAATDLYGNTVTEATLGEKEVYFVYYWATWCGACVRGLPALAKIAEDYSDRVGFIGLLDDYKSNLAGAKKAVESAGIPDSFIMINARLPEVSDIYELVQSGYLPTSFILSVDDQIGLVGSYGEKFADYLDDFLD